MGTQGKRNHCRSGELYSELVLSLGEYVVNDARELQQKFGIANIRRVTEKAPGLENPGPNSYKITAALHSYFNLGDVSMVDILGLEGVEYIDQLGNNRWEVQNGPVSFDGELDRIYYPASGEELLRDRMLKRTIRLTATGSRSTIVWNPWIKKSDSMADFEKGGYRHLVRVETGNAAGDIIELAPNSSHELGVVISTAGTERLA